MTQQEEHAVSARPQHEVTAMLGEISEADRQKIMSAAMAIAEIVRRAGEPHGSAALALVTADVAHGMRAEFGRRNS